MANQLDENQPIDPQMRKMLEELHCTPARSRGGCPKQGKILEGDRLASMVSSHLLLTVLSLICLS